jgi:hypothetical protein
MLGADQHMVSTRRAPQDGFPAALHTYLRRTFAGMDHEPVLAVLRPLFTQTTTYYDDEGRKRCLIEVGMLERIRRGQANQPKRRAGEQAMRRHNRRIDSLISHVRAAPITGRGRRMRIIAELKAERFPLKGKLPPVVPARGERSALGWLPHIARPLTEYLATATGQRPDSILTYRLAAHILQHATGDQRITPEMVKARLLRARGQK